MISLGSTDTEWVNTARDYPELLNFFRPEPSLYDFYGTTDVAVVQRSAVRSANIRSPPCVSVKTHSTCVPGIPNCLDAIMHDAVESAQGRSRHYQAFGQPWCLKEM